MDSAMEFVSEGERGRPYGGISWLINKNNQIENTEIINHKISILKIENNINIIGVYLHCNNGRKDNFDHHLQDVIQLESIIETLDIMIIGDFNSDNHRKNKFDKMLIDMIKRKNIKILDDRLYRSLKKEDRYTYEGGNGGRSWIDHVICNKQMKEEVLSI